MRRAGFALLALAACDDMGRQARYDPFEPAGLFANGRVAQDPVPGTVDFTRPEPPVAFAPTLATLERGQRRYAVACTPCHGPTGAGDGMVVGRFVPAPPSFHGDAQRRDLTPGRIAHVIVAGIGRMAPHARQVPPDERLPVAWYVKALQLSQHATVGALPPATPYPPVRPDDAGGEMTPLRRERLARLAAGLEALHTPAWIDRPAGVARIPIGEAMRRTARGTAVSPARSPAPDGS